jgi:hypothetical protein
VDPTDPDIVYGGSYGGYLQKINHRTRETRLINVWPDTPIGHAAENLKYRFQWNYPIFFSPHDPKCLYAAANVLFKTTDGGQSWTAISPDLTRNDKSKQGASGGPITKDNTSVEYYCTIFAALESPHEAGVLWCGSDDGLVHLSRDGGKTWNKVTPPDLPEWSMINSLEPHPTEKGGLYLAATRYKLDDDKPYLYRTLDYGKTWTKIVTGIKENHFTRVVRADPKKPGLLYAGTEAGMYVSFDDGAKWESFQLNLPLVPITDLTIKDNDLIVATQGRSFWILDDLTFLHQRSAEALTKPLHLFKPRDTYRLPGGGGGGGDEGGPTGPEGQNPPNGVLLRFHLKEAPAKEAKGSLEFLNASGKVVRQFRTDATERGEKLEVKAGMNRFVWNLRHTDAEGFPGLILWGSLTGPRVSPGTYTARLKIGGQEQSTSFVVKPDPRSSASKDDYETQEKFLIAARDKLTETHRAIKTIRDVREQMTAMTKRLSGDEAKEIKEAATALEKKLTAIEEALHQTKAKSSQDVLNYPIRLNNKLAALAGTVGAGDNRPTDAAIKLHKELTDQIDAELAKLRTALAEDLPKFNDLLREKKVPGVFSGSPSKK